MDSFCAPYVWGPFTGGWISLCFTDLLFFSISSFLIVFGGGIRFLTVRRLSQEPRKYTKSHIAELIASALLVLSAAVHFIYLLATQFSTIAQFKYLGSIGQAIVYLLSLVLCEIEYQRGVKHNWILLSFWVLVSTIGGVRLEAIAYEESSDTQDPATIYFIVIELIASVFLALNSLFNNDIPPSLNEEEEHQLYDEKQSLIFEKKESYGGLDLSEKPRMMGEKDSGFFSWLSFWWITPLLKKGFYTSLVHSDLPPLRDDDDPHLQHTNFENAWAEQEMTNNPSLVKALFKAYWRRILVAALFKLGNDLFIFTGPVVLEQVILFVQNPGMDIWVGLTLAFAMFAGSTVQSLAMQQYWQQVYRLSMNVKAAMITQVYSKSMRLSHRERQKTTVGEITNLQSVDTNRLSGIIIFINQIWSAPLQIIVSCALLYRVLSWACFGGVAVLILTSPFQILTGKILASYTKEQMQKRDARLKMTNEVLQGIRVIKFFAWEISFFEKIKDVRWAELVILRSSAFIRAAIGLIWALTPLLVTLVSFGIFVATGGVLTAEKAFTALSLFNVMRFPLNILPMVITQLIEAQVSLERLQKFFCGEELNPENVEEDAAEKSVVSIKDGIFEWETGKPILNDINIDIPKGSLVCVVGEVGSGKSSLLSAILGEMGKVNGRVVVNGSVAYVPQSSWIKNATLRDNIIFMNDVGKGVDESRYNQVLKICQLQPDLAILPAADKTEIGEKGINLSGGQKQRVSMARSVYSNSDIYILDDPLSAVDAHVGKSLFVDCIKNYLGNKTRILVTHQLQFTGQCDLIIMMKDGKIIEMGTYDQLMKSGKAFATLISKYVFETDALAGKKDEPQEEIKKPEEKKKPEIPKGDGKLIQGEKKGAGGISISVYSSYITAIGGFVIAFLVVGLYAAETAASMVANYWLSYWSVVADTTPPPAPEPVQTFFSSSRSTLSVSELGFGNHKIFDELGLGVYFYLMIYGVIGAIDAVIILLRSFILAQAGINASKTLHNRMLDRILRAPTSFFDTEPVGRILNRFSSDQNTVDVELPRTLGSALDTVLTSVSVIFVIASATPIFLVSLISLSFLYRFVQKYYLHSSRELQRLDSVSRSPIYALFSETLNGVTTIRAYDKAYEFIKHNEDKVRYNQQATYMSFTSNRWLGVFLEGFGSCIVFAATFFAVVGRDTIDPGMAGLSITYALRLTSNLNWLVRMSTEVENNLISVERCTQTLQTVNEAPFENDYKPPHGWPSRGSIQLHELSLKYREGLPLVLRGINADIKSQEKIGVVGRTGSGKSSLMLALFRMVEPANGRIIIDDVDVSNLGLHELRSKLSIIPQDPTLFNGTIRTNLDPFEMYNTKALWEALDAVGLSKQVKEMQGELDARVSEGGENLSVGSRQLLCLARALLKRSKILVMDEATANVDFDTDELIQKTIRKEFKHVTTLTIAHRIKTIMDSDRVMVLDNGKLVEFDTPSALLRNTNSVFYGLAKEAGLAEKAPPTFDILL